MTMDDCVACAESFGERARGRSSACRSTSTGTPPVPTTGALSSRSGRASTRGSPNESRVRRWAPDYGPAAFVPEWGATAAGARGFLIAYNVNILGTKEQAHRIALNVREAGGAPASRGGSGRCAPSAGRSRSTASRRSR